MKFVTNCLQLLGPFIVAIALTPAMANAQSSEVQTNEPMDFLDQPEGTVNCVVSATASSVPWDHRFTYWLSGIAQFDDQGNMMTVPVSHGSDWVLTITNSRFPQPKSHNLVVLGPWSQQPEFAFPAVSEAEWNAMGQRATADYVTVFSYEESANGLYVAIRNTEFSENVRQMVQVVHYLTDDVAIVSEAAPCFIGPRPPAPADIFPSRNIVPQDPVVPQDSDE